MSTSKAQTVRLLLRKGLRGDRRAISQLMSVAENDPRARIQILSETYWKTGRAHVIGMTGPPGCGKSTLVARLAKRYREEGARVGIVAIDPSSQVTGGALLGDRIRMTDLASDTGVFIRSMATRGNVGGIARATEDVVRILDASSMDYVIVETAGAGQSDVDIKELADTTVVVTAPGLGDEIQALKAGIMEIGDIFIVNKADKENADLTAQQIHSTIMMSEGSGWRPRVIKTTATTGDGVPGLSEAIAQHSKYLKESKENVGLDKRHIRNDMVNALRRFFDEITITEIISSREFERLTKQVQSRKLDPYTAARKLIASLGKRSRSGH